MFHHYCVDCNAFGHCVWENGAYRCHSCYRSLEERMMEAAEEVSKYFGTESNTPSV